MKKYMTTVLNWDSLVNESVAAELESGLEQRTDSHWAAEECAGNHGGAKNMKQEAVRMTGPCGKRTRKTC